MTLKNIESQHAVSHTSDRLNGLHNINASSESLPRLQLLGISQPLPAMTSKDTTFRAFTPQDAANYAQGRGSSYPPALYQTILDFHQGDRNLVLDVGTGPGKVVFDLLPFFDRGIGCDTSAGMIEQAKTDAQARGLDEKTGFVLAGGEDCASALDGRQVDAITVAMTAHWLDMPAFYASAAKALRPGGTLAIWTCSSFYCHPSMPNHERVQAVLSDLEDNVLAPYNTPGNMMTRNAYEDLPLPWTAGSQVFDETSFSRKDWDRDGVPSAPPMADGTPGPFLISSQETPLTHLAKAFGSGSMVVRWRQANLERAHGPEDIINVIIERLREALGGGTSLLASPSCSLLLMRKK